MAEFFRSLDAQLKLKRVLEFFVALVVVLVLIAIAMSIFEPVYENRYGNVGISYPPEEPTYMGGSSSGGFSYDVPYQYEDVNESKAAPGQEAPALSARNTAGFGRDAEMQVGSQVQTRTYTAEFRTTNVAHTCQTLKQLVGVEKAELVQSSMSNEWCTLRYRVERDATQAFVDALAARNPENLVEVVEDIEETVRDFTGVRSALEKKQALLSETLETSTAAYDELIALSTERGDAEALSVAISGKLAHLERLTREELMLEEELRTLDRRLAKEFERVRYSFFDLTVTSYPHVPLTELKESWASAMRELAVRTNSFVQGVTVGLVLVLLLVVQLALYVGVVFVIGRFVVRRIRPHLACLVPPSSVPGPKQHSVARSRKPVA